MSKPSGSKLSVSSIIKSAIIFSIDFSEFKAIKNIRWGSCSIPCPSLTSIILKNEKGKNKYSFSFGFFDFSPIEITDLQLFCSMINLIYKSFGLFLIGLYASSLREVEVKEGKQITLFFEYKYL